MISAEIGLLLLSVVVLVQMLIFGGLVTSALVYNVEGDSGGVNPI